MQTLKSAEKYDSYSDYFAATRALADNYGDLGMDAVFRAWSRASRVPDPYEQNTRVKRISSFPADYSKDDIVEMVKAPDSNETGLRQTAHALEWTAYPYRKLRTTYQALTGYNYYHYPAYIKTSDEAKSDTLWREGTLIDKLNKQLRPDVFARQAVGQCLQEGKVAYIPRYSIDKPHNKVNYAFFQQIPSDWWKIVGFNSESKYTVMFNMVYFVSVVGADWRQFGDLFTPYLRDFDSVIYPVSDYMPDGLGKSFVYASRDYVKGKDGRRYAFDLRKFNEIKGNAAGDPQLYNANGRWAYWVTLPVDRCWVMEADDSTRTVAPPFAGLFLTFDQLAALEDVQLEILQNPLVSVALGEIPYKKQGNENTSDQYELSPAGRLMFLAYWEEMLARWNTGGIGAYFAPVENLHIESLAEAPNATNISTEGYAYAIEKSGLSGVLPISDNPRAGAVDISTKIEEQYCKPVIQQAEAMMNSIYAHLGLKHEWRFKFLESGLLSKTQDLEDCRKGITQGMLSETFRYLALRGMSVFDDISMSRVVMESGLLDMRIPPLTSFTAKSGATLPPNPDNQGGRPTKSIEDVGSGNGGESTEDSIDAD